ncbi:MAG: hypothetical protein DWQ02_08015 [Bacteroidetes bacterium]|nr:MAG: hypothetical protein DWQ02_08015 [Bacteroidota bacterium]
MKSITIHKLDPELATAIEKIVQTTGLSQNKVIKKLLKKALGLEDNGGPKRDLSKFAGKWSKEEADAFDESTANFEQIDEDLWQ